jgi:hypothetical protein
VRTEELYKRLNEEIATLLDGGARMFLCECGNPLCNEPIELIPEDLRTLHARPGFYAIAKGHEIPDLETVVMENHHYAIVRKDIDTLMNGGRPKFDASMDGGRPKFDASMDGGRPK